MWSEESLQMESLLFIKSALNKEGEVEEEEENRALCAMLHLWTEIWMDW